MLGESMLCVLFGVFVGVRQGVFSFLWPPRPGRTFEAFGGWMGLKVAWGEMLTQFNPSGGVGLPGGRCGTVRVSVPRYDV